MKEILSNGSMRSIAQAIEEMKAEQGESFSLENINLAELERRSGVSRGKLRRLKRNGFQDLPRATKGRKHTVMDAALFIEIGVQFLQVLIHFGKFHSCVREQHHVNGHVPFDHEQ